MQKELFPAPTPAGNRLEALHGITAYAHVCSASSSSLWGLGFDQMPLIVLGAEAAAREIVASGASLAMPGVNGTVDELQEYGVEVYHAFDTVPALFNRRQCAPTLALSLPAQHAFDTVPALFNRRQRAPPLARIAVTSVLE